MLVHVWQLQDMLCCLISRCIIKESKAGLKKPFASYYNQIPGILCQAVDTHLRAPCAFKINYLPVLSNASVFGRCSWQKPIFCISVDNQSNLNLWHLVKWCKWEAAGWITAMIGEKGQFCISSASCSSWSAGLFVQKHFKPNTRLNPRDTNTFLAKTNWKPNEREINYAETLYWQLALVRSLSPPFVREDYVENSSHRQLGLFILRLSSVLAVGTQRGNQLDRRWSHTARSQSSVLPGNYSEMLFQVWVLVFVWNKLYIFICSVYLNQVSYDLNRAESVQWTIGVLQ